MNTKTKLRVTLAMAISCSAVFGAGSITNTNLLVIGEGAVSWLKVHVLKPAPGQYSNYDWSVTSPTNIEIICTHQPVITGPTNGEWVIHFK